MGKHQLFSAEEWQVLQFAVLDVFMMVSEIEGAPGMDEAEENAFIDLLHSPTSIENTLLRELLASIGPTWKHVLDAYNAQYRYSRSYFEQAFLRVGTLVDHRLGNEEAQAFKVALTTHLGGIIGNASGSGEPGMGKLSDDELQAITAIAIWLGTETNRQGARIKLT